MNFAGQDLRGQSFKGRTDLQDMATFKTHQLRQQYIIETDAADKFKLDHQIREAEAQLSQVQKKLTELEDRLS